MSCFRRLLACALVFYLTAIAGVFAADCNENGVDDATEIGAGTSLDCNANGVPDECDIAPLFSLGEPTTYLDEAGTLTASIVAADFDGDHQIDVAVTVVDEKTQVPVPPPQVGSEAPTKVVILLNAGLGTLVEVGEVKNPRFAVHIAAADVDLDGDVDLVKSSVTEQTVSVLINDGTGTFEAGQSLAVAGYPGRPQLVDLDNDGDEDVVVDDTVNDDVEDSPLVSLVINKGDGTFSAPRTLSLGDSVLVADLDGDLAPDLVANESGRFIVFRANDGAGSFRRSRRVGEGNVLASGDLNGDRAVDLIVEPFRQEGRSVLLNQGDASFVEAFRIGFSWYFPTLVDLDGDGDLDLVASGADHNTLFDQLNDGEGGFGGVSTHLFGTSTWSKAAADLNDDAKVDLALAGPLNPYFTVLLNETQPGPSDDANHDGVPDECPTAGRQLPSDSSQDGKLNLTDAVWLLRHLFHGANTRLPCEGGTAASPGGGELLLLDSNGDQVIDIADSLGILGWLFLPDRPPPVLGTGCRPLRGCPDACRN